MGKQAMLQKLHSSQTHPDASGILHNLTQKTTNPVFHAFPPKTSYIHTHTCLCAHIFMCNFMLVWQDTESLRKQQVTFVLLVLTET